jgi:competence protein ComEC
LASAIIWVWVLPLIAYYFQQISPWAVPGGVLLLPLTVVALLAGAGKIILTLLCPWFAGAWAAAALFPAVLLRNAVARLALLPAAGMAMPPPAWWTFIFYYALLLLPLIPWRRSGIRWVARLAWIPACCALLALPSSTLAQTILPGMTGGLRVTFLSVGSGQTALFRVNRGENFFIDCGSSTDSDLYTRVIHPFLLHEGVRRIDGLVLSTPDYDHISAAAEIIRSYAPTAVHVTPFFRTRAAAVTSQTLLNLLDTRGPPPTLLAAGDRLSVGPGATLQVLWPPRGGTMSAANSGMVLKLAFAGRSILFPADIETAPQLALLTHPDLLKADVLVGPRRGSAENCTPAFLRAVNPRWIICSNDPALNKKQLLFDQIAQPRPVYRTDSRGAIDLTIRADGTMDISTFVH